MRINLAKSVPIVGGTGTGTNTGIDSIDGVETDVTTIQKQGAMRLLIMLLLPIALYVYETQNIPAMRSTLSSKQTLLESLQAKNEQAKGAVEEIKKFKEDQAKLQKQIDTLDALQKERLLEVKILDNLQKDIPEKVWLESIEFNDGKMTLKGFAMTGQDLTVFFESLSKSAFLQESHLVKETEFITKKANFRQFEIYSIMDTAVKKPIEVAR